MLGASEMSNLLGVVHITSESGVRAVPTRLQGRALRTPPSATSRTDRHVVRKPLLPGVTDLLFQGLEPRLPVFLLSFSPSFLLFVFFPFISSCAQFRGRAKSAGLTTLGQRRGKPRREKETPAILTRATQATSSQPEGLSE